MANLKDKEQLNTGFGNNAASFGNRLINKNGIPNIEKAGVSPWETISTFHTLLKISWLRFIAYTFLAFVLVNVLFTLIYLIAGINNLNGIEGSSLAERVAKVFFFSVQTFTTVGYGHISPANIATSTISAIEAFTGLLFFALVTGLLYARFSKPNAFLKFSFHAVIAPYEEGTALMFRMTPTKNNHLTEVEVKLSLSLVEEVNGVKKTEFYVPKLEIDRINSLVLSWTIVHPIDEESAVFGFTKKDFEEKRFELLVFVRAFDETYSSNVVARTSYTAEELKCGYKFVPMYQRTSDGSKTKLELNKLDELREAPLPLIKVKEIAASSS